MAFKHLSILSLNARGLREKNKRENLFFWLKEKNAEIIFLQETYWTEELLSKIEREWGAKILLCQAHNIVKGQPYFSVQN